MTPNYSLHGVVHTVFSTEEVGTSNFKKRELIVETPGQYPQQIRLEAHNKKCAALDGLKAQQEVEVSFTIKGKCHQGKYFTNLVIREVNVKGEIAQPDLPKAEAAVSAPAGPGPDDEDIDNDVPF